MQIKRCGEMARTLRLVKEQMTKAGVSPSTQSTRDNGVNLESLEVVMCSEIVITHSSVYEFSTV